MNEDTLLAEILANPDDDAPRLVYADALIARGDPRGEFITLQIQKPDDERAKALWREHGARWSADAGLNKYQPPFARGFPNELIGTSQELASMRGAIATQPITALRIAGEQEPGAELLALPELARIRQLHRIGPIADDGLEALAHSPHLGALVRLFIQRGAVPQSALGARIQILAPRIAALHKLYLGDCGLGVDGARALATVSAPRLEYLAVTVEHGGECMAAIVDSPIVTTVTSLSFNANHGGVQGARAIARSPHLANVRELVLSNNSLGAEAAEALGDSQTLASLEELDLQHNELGHAGVDALARGTGLPKLRTLDLMFNNVGSGRYNSGWFDGDIELEETAEELKKRFPHRPNLKILGQHLR